MRSRDVDGSQVLAQVVDVAWAGDGNDPGLLCQEPCERDRPGYAARGNSPVVQFAGALNALIVAGDAIAVLPIHEIATPGRRPAFRLP